MKSSTIKIAKLTKSMSSVSKAKLYVVLFFLFLSQVALSLYLCDFTWLASFGGLLTVVGLLLIFSQSFLAEYESEAETLHADSLPEQIVVGGMQFGELVTSKAEIEKILDERKKIFVEKYSNISLYLFLTVFGTLLWAYGGFINGLYC